MKGEAFQNFFFFFFFHCLLNIFPYSNNKKYFIFNSLANDQGTNQKERKKERKTKKFKNKNKNKKIN